MNTPHPPDDSFERFVSGEPGPWAAFEEHLRGCEPCARRLQQEAQADVALYVIAQSPPAPRRLRARTVVIAAGLALAASLAFLILGRPSPPPLTPFAFDDLVGEVSPDDAVSLSELPQDVPEAPSGETP